ncbi:MAG: DUF368 domain-containing protein [Clostridia bacterium]|nr:DUF368 domain-containing protein [Clostridia bacterium]
MKGTLRYVITGFLMGCTMSVPGVSGGTTAMALGYYEPMMKAAAFPQKKENLLFLLRLGIGGVAGFFSGAKVLNLAFLRFPLAVTLLFGSAVLYGCFCMAKETVRYGIGAHGIFLFLTGFLTVLAVERIPPAGECDSFFLQILWGVFLAAGFILPGISTSHLLTVFGLYGALSQWTADTLSLLLPLGIGLGLGTVLLIKPLSAAWDRFPAECNLALLGFSVGSLGGLVKPCLQSPRLTYLPLLQIGVGLVLAVGACLLLRKMQKNNS